MGREHDLAVAHVVGAMVMCILCEDNIDRGFHCVDCDVLTASSGCSEYYMVQHELWSVYGVRYGMLCIGCLERRMGRELTSADFLDCPLNRVEYQPKSLRLMRRLGYAS